MDVLSGKRKLRVIFAEHWLLCFGSPIFKPAETDPVQSASEIPSCWSIVLDIYVRLSSIDECVTHPFAGSVQDTVIGIVSNAKLVRVLKLKLVVIDKQAK